MKDARLAGIYTCAIMITCGYKYYVEKEAILLNE